MRALTWIWFGCCAGSFATLVLLLTFATYLKHQQDNTSNRNEE